MGANHHGGQQPPNPELDALMKRFVEQAEGRAKREYPAGRLGAADDGALAMAVTGDREKGVIVVDFGKPVVWFGLTPESAVGLARLLVQKAREVSREPLEVVIG